MASGSLAVRTLRLLCPTVGRADEDFHAKPDACAEREFGSGMKFVNGDTLLARITPCLENAKHDELIWFHDVRNGQYHAGGATEQPYGVRDCAVRDPAGNLLRIQERR